MTDQHEDLRQKVALFRVRRDRGPRLARARPEGDLCQARREGVEDLRHPGQPKADDRDGDHPRLAEAVPKGKGFDGLLPKPRRDIGESHSIPKEVQDLLLTIKEDNPDYSVSVVIDEARTIGSIDPDLALPPSTVYRLLARHGLMRGSRATRTARRIGGASPSRRLVSSG
jgi:putative transposase